jgi:glucose-6-phosphate isomerase
VTTNRTNAQTLDLGPQDVVSRTEDPSILAECAGFQLSRLRPALDRLAREGFSRRLWEKDPTLWKTDDASVRQIRNSLGWLDLPTVMKERVAEIEAFVREVLDAGYSHVVHMGMGGSSLAPIVFQSLFETGPRGLPLLVLDSTDPFTVASIEQKIALTTTLFVVASKSGTTAEPSAFCDYFYSRVRAVKGDKAGENFVAITDPDTILVNQAKERGFRRVFLNFADVGGRYSALSYVGLLPAALMGLEIVELIDRGECMRKACGPMVTESENPGIVLGVVMAEMARMGRDKITFLMSPALSCLGMWLEQLIAESTGKEGTGILPVIGEPGGDPLVYSNDRLFVHIREKGKRDADVEKGVEQLRKADLPVVHIEIRDAFSVVQEFFRWEMATATAGAILGINPFDQPNVQEAKDATNRFLKGVEEKGFLMEPAVTATHGPLSFFSTRGDPNPDNLLRDLLFDAQPGDYVSLQTYIPEEIATKNIMESIRLRVREVLRVATTIGYGPRLLHSTGQFHKGGPDNGVFLQLTAGDVLDISIPGKSYTFGTFKRAQALGDFETLVRHGRKALRVDLGGDPERGLAQLERLAERILAEGVKK